VAKPSSEPERHRRKRSAVFTNEGLREHRLHLLWLGGSLAAVALIVLVGWLLTLDSAEHEAVAAYIAAPADPAQRRRPLRHEAMRRRALLLADRNGRPTVAFDTLDGLRFGAARVIRGVDLAGALERVRGLRWQRDLGLWLAPAQVEAARDLAAGKTGAALARILGGHKIASVDGVTFAKSLSTLSEEDREPVLDLLTGQPGTALAPLVEAWIDQGKGPESLQLRSLEGREGWMLLDNGSDYRREPRPYQGTLIRAVGGGWPEGWQVLNLLALPKPKP
jgi:hypothetical protein